METTTNLWGPIGSVRCGNTVTCGHRELAHADKGKGACMVATCKCEEFNGKWLSRKDEHFATWADLLAHLKTTEVVRYHAPMDISARHVRAKAFKNGKVRVYPDSWKAFDAFTADEGHLSRFSKAKEEE